MGPEKRGHSDHQAQRETGGDLPGHSFGLDETPVYPVGFLGYG